MNKYQDVSVVAAKLGMHPSTIYRLIKAGELKAVKLGVKKGIKVIASSVQQFEERRIEGSVY